MDYNMTIQKHPTNYKQTAVILMDVNDNSRPPFEGDIAR